MDETWAVLIVASVIILGMGWYGGAGCGCCTSCVLASDDFNRASLGSDWTTVSGSWSIVSNELSGTSTGILRWTADIGENYQTVSAALNGGTNGDRLRLVLAYTDSSNYLWGEIYFNGASGAVRVGQVVGGTETQLGTKTGTFTAGTPYTLNVCYNGTSLVATSGITSAVRSSAGTHSGTYAGVALKTVGSTATWDDWQVKNHRLTDGTCPGCGVYGCTGCYSFMKSPVTLVELSGVSGSCSGANDCATLSGTFIAAINTSLDFGGCINSYPIGTLGYIACDTEAVGDRILRIQAAFSQVGGDTYAVTVQIVSDGGNRAVFYGEYDRKSNTCIDLVDFSLPQTSGDTTPCDFSSMTCSITAV